MPNESCRDCDGFDTCSIPRCVGPCDSADELPSSAGCSFIANRQLHLDQTAPDALVVANPNSELVATVQLFHVPEGKRKEEPVGEPIMLAPLEWELFELSSDFVLGTSSMFRSGGMYRVESDAPIIAYQHAPAAKNRGNDSAMLLPESTLRQDYVVSSYSPHREQPEGHGVPSYFEIIALSDQTSVSWVPTYADTAGNGLPIKAVRAGEVGTQKMNRFDTMRVVAGTNWIYEGQCEYYQNSGAEPDDISKCYDAADVSGTVISADKPVWVVGASRCSRVPVRDFPARGKCDPLQELLIPIDYWGRKYVAARSPIRENENHYWRVYGGGEGVTVTTDPPQPGLIEHTFSQRGEYVELEVPNGTSFIIEGDGAFMPVQYLQSHRTTGEDLATSADMGDATMYQMVPVAQFLSRYVFVTGFNFDRYDVQIIKRIDGPDVVLDGITVEGYTPVGDYEYADVVIDEGAHVVDSDGPFGIIQVGYTVGDSPENCPDPFADPPVCLASYGYPGGMKFELINVP
jgi:hypothetical protein